ncbi:MAG: cytochrome c [Acidimicrobiia bacterium]|nr:cytochrome c [Acidimicrobiia bacterium]
MRSVVMLGVGGLLFIALMAAAAAQEVGSPSVLALQGSDGAVVYQAKCASCHQADGSGIAGAFPPLAGNPNAADGAYVESVILEGLSGPIDVLGVTYDTMMPAVTDLSSDELAAVVAYVGTLAGGDQPVPTTAAPPSGGDSVHGEKLFRGTAGFAAGGAACAACHSAGDIGFGGGSGLGPDLSDVFDRFGGEAGLGGWLGAPAAAAMQPLYDDKPLTDGEIADLTAFLATTTNVEPAGGIDVVLIGAIVVMLLLLGFMAWRIKGPNETYNQRLRSKQ